MTTRIPSLTSLRAFEAVARHLSFRKAADELFVTHAAISHQIKLLEGELGVKLFNRTTRSVTLTDQGGQYFPIIRDSLHAIARGTEDLQQSQHYEEIVIQSYSSFIQTWLMLRLTQFQRDNPIVHVRLKTSFEDGDFQHDQFDIGIFKKPVFDDRISNLELFRTRMFPVCSPALLEGNFPLSQPADLKHHLLLQIPSSKNEPDDWSLWLSAAGINPKSVRFGAVFDNYPLALQATLEGQGVAMARQPFAAADLASRRLVKPFELSVDEPGSWFQVTRRNETRNSANDLFANWLQQQIASDANLICPAQT